MLVQACNVALQKLSCCFRVDVPAATTAFVLLGFILIDCNWTGVYLMTAELFPTIIR